VLVWTGAENLATPFPPDLFDSSVQFKQEIEDTEYVASSDKWKKLCKGNCFVLDFSCA
jgi:hypothetical protein